MNPYKKVFLALNKAHIQYLIVGGVAVNLYGYARFTGDIDILLALNSQNLIKMAKIMKRLGYVERLPITLHDLQNPKKIKQWLKQKGMTAYTFISDKRPQLDIDILVQSSLDFKKFNKKKTVIKTWNMNVPVISINDLIVMKRRANRPKDLIDLKVLLQLKNL